MFLPFAYHTITRVRAATVTDAGNATVRSWASATSTSITNVHMQPVSSVELHDQEQDQKELDYRLFTPPGVDIRATDRIEYAGKTFEVVGDGMPHPDPLSAGIGHVVYNLSEVRG